MTPTQLARCPQTVPPPPHSVFSCRRTGYACRWVARDRDNAQALTSFMRRVQNLPPIERLQQPNFKFTVGDPARPEVDILTSVAGAPSFNDAITRCQRLMLATRRVPVIGVTDLLDIKTASALQMELEADLPPVFNPTST